MCLAGAGMFLYNKSGKPGFNISYSGSLTVYWNNFAAAQLRNYNLSQSNGNNIKEARFRLNAESGFGGG